MTRAMTETRMGLLRLRGHPWIQLSRLPKPCHLLTDLHTFGGSTASLGQSLTWPRISFPIIPPPVQRHAHLYHIRIMLMLTLLLHISKEMLCLSSANASTGHW